MTQLATNAPATLSQPAAELVRQWAAGYTLGTVPASVRDEARRKLPAIQAQLAPADARAWQAFLRPLVGAVRNPPAADALSVFAATCAASLTDIPARLLTGDAQREACRRFAFWPAVADLAEWLEPDAAPLRLEARTLRRICDAPTDAAPEPMPEAQREIVAADMARLAAELRASAEAKQPPSAAAHTRPLTAPTLAAMYRREADQLASEGAIHRAQALHDRANMLDPAHG